MIHIIRVQIGFYKTFARPVAKVLLMSTFTYQLVYWLWVKLETDEIKAEKQGKSGQEQNRERKKETEIVI